MNEINLLRELDHPNIIKMYEYFQDNDKIYIITEICSGGELYEKINKRKGKGFTDVEVAKIIE